MSKFYLDFKKRIIFLIAMVCSLQTFAQNVTVTGKVTSAEDGSGVPGVNILVKGTSTGTITDFDGNFSLSAPSDGVLVFSFVGFQAQEVSVNGRTSIDVSLQPDVTALSEVVVVGYGTQEKKEITSAVTSIDSKEFNQGNVPNVSQLLQGKVSGLVIARPGGDPNENFTIRLRGLSTLGANSEPLFVIDGVIGAPLSTVDPNDIDRMEVLKDGSAAAIYGVRGSSGVILVTTKAGDSKNNEINYNGFVAVETIAKRWEVLDRDGYLNTISNSLGADEAAARDLGANTNWFDEISQTGVSQSHNLSFSGGADNSNYRVSFTARDQKAVAQGTGFTSLNGRLNFRQRFLDDILSFNTSIAFQTRDADLGFAEAFRYAVTFNPTAPIRQPDGSFTQIDAFDIFNPVAIIEQGVAESRRTRILASIGGEIDLGFLVDGLRLTGSYSQFRQNDLDGEAYAKDARFVRSSFLGNGGNAAQDGFAQRNAFEGFAELIEATANYERNFGDLDVTFLGGYSYQEITSQGVLLAGGDFVTDATGFNNLSFAQDFDNGLGAVGGFNNTQKLLAGFGRVNAVYNNTYFASATYRREGSSLFGVNNRWGNFYALSGGVEIANLVSLPEINNLKFRVSYGVTGGLPGQANLAQDILAPSGSVLVNGTFVQSFTPVQNPNPNLTFEEKAELDIGVDIAAFDGKLQATFDWYTRDTRDLLISTAVPVPPNLVNTTVLNAGSFDNTGFEGFVSYKGKITSELEWEGSINFATFTTELTDFNETVQDRGNVGAPGLNQIPTTRVAIGEEIGNFFGPVFTGIGEDGAWQFADLDGDGVVEAGVGEDDNQVLGNGLPDLTVGINNTFKYKGFEFNMFWRGAFGHDLININRVFYEAPTQIGTWNLLQSSANVTNLGAGPIFSSFHVEEADFVRLDNATIAKEWKFPDGNGPFTRFKVFITGQNLLTITNYSGVEPEVRFADTGSVDNGGRSNSGAGDILVPGIDRRNTWFTTRTFTLGVNFAIR